MCGRLYAGVWSGCGKEIVLLHLRFLGQGVMREACLRLSVGMSG